jgi:hypothetical protein
MLVATVLVQMQLLPCAFVCRVLSAPAHLLHFFSTTQTEFFFEKQKKRSSPAWPLAHSLTLSPCPACPPFPPPAS